MAKGNNTLLIFDFDNTITNGHMHNIFSGKHSGFKKSDFNSGAEYAVNDTDIGNFLKNTGGVKNKETLKSVLQSALSNGVKVNIASYTGYSDAVRRVVENHLGLSKEQAGGISVFGGFPGDYDNELPKGLKEQKNQVGKNLHICKAIVEYKDKHGELPKTVMLVDDDVKNIQKINEFVASMSKREEWLEKNGLSIEEIQKIKFEGVRVPKEDKNVGYLGKVQKFINTSLIQEPNYENSREQESLYAKINKSTVSLEKEMETIKSVLINNGYKLRKEVHSVQDLFKEEAIRALKEQGYGVSNKDRKEIVVKGSKQIDIQKVQEIIKDASDRVIEGFKASKIVPEESIYQNFEDIKSALKVQAKPIHKSASPSLPQKRKSSDGMVTDCENKKQVYTETISLAQEFKAIKAFFKDCIQEVINAICNLFRREVATKIEGQGYNVSSKQGSSEITVKGSKPIDASRINKDIIVESLAQIIEKKEKIKDLNNNYKGDQLGREISKLLNAGLQKENINSNYNDGEPIFQTREEASNYPPQKKDINSNSVRGNYNDGEPTHQTVQEAWNYHQQKKNKNLNPASSTTPQGQASSSPPRSNIKEACSSQHIASIVKQPNQYNRIH
ncbi:hypothetical protein [Wolbachia endosymbiont (group A) of Epistrophe grossularia]|uniref:hypothetical protein n=1 Tax=Wolbachia endosymbiont (group A) of Epistrophe grossularia TaxID=2954008 RepID=UPI00222F393A|nr:hypothetical protein [Wolbachia endosymbiont (group A) of Epistrophe grossularia]